MLARARVVVSRRSAAVRHRAAWRLRGAARPEDADLPAWALRRRGERTDSVTDAVLAERSALAARVEEVRRRSQHEEALAMEQYRLVEELQRIGRRCRRHGEARRETGASRRREEPRCGERRGNVRRSSGDGGEDGEQEPNGGNEVRKGVSSLSLSLSLSLRFLGSRRWRIGGGFYFWRERAKKGNSTFGGAEPIPPPTSAPQGKKEKLSSESFPGKHMMLPAKNLLSPKSH